MSKAEVPEWLALLVQARANMGFPPVVEIAARSGLSTKTVYRVFGGRSSPNYHTLWTLADALTEDADAAARIVAALGNARVVAAPPAVSDAEVIAKAIRDAGAMIAKAIQDSHDTTR